MAEDKQIYPVWYKFRPRNREERRMFYFEREKIIDRLIEIEASFILHLFRKEYDTIAYRTIYAFHLESYIAMVRWINKELTPKYCIIHEHYFEEMYKPMENEIDETFD